jgi:hypothetical protein
VFDWPNAYLQESTSDQPNQIGLRKEAIIPKYTGPVFSSTPATLKKRFGEEAKGTKATEELNEQIKSLRANVSIR